MTMYLAVHADGGVYGWDALAVFRRAHQTAGPAARVRLYRLTPEQERHLIRDDAWNLERTIQQNPILMEAVKR